MVHRMSDVEEFPTQQNLCRKKVKVKSEFKEDTNYGVSSKKPKLHFSNEEKDGEFGVLENNNPLLEEPSPLGLKLKKSPSFLDLIQMKLSQEKGVSLARTLARKEKSGGGGGGSDNKLKASNFAATLLKIGTWEYKSRYEGDLVAKCYFAKHKLVWEVLDGGLKNKIEIQWSDIMAIKGNYPDNEPGTLDVVLSRQPSFFREINPQPRKHTLWQATTDFTCGQASLHRRHFLQFPQGILGKHFQKLIQCDPRLSFLSQQPEIVLDTPLFQPAVSIFGDDSEHGFELKTEGRFSFSGIRDAVSVSGLSSSEIESQNLTGLTRSSPRNSRLNPGMYTMEGDVSSKFNETYGIEILNQIKLPGLTPSMSVGDLVNHIGDCISEQMRSDDSNVPVSETRKSEVLKEITQYLLNDSHMLTSSDEKSIMSRVNSLCCLLHKEDAAAQTSTNEPFEDRTTPDLASVGNTKQEGMYLTNQPCEDRIANTLPAAGSEVGFGIDSQQGASMSRKDSVDELLLNLPRIASLPQFLIPEDSGNLAR